MPGAVHNLRLVIWLEATARTNVAPGPASWRIVCGRLPTEVVVIINGTIHELGIDQKARYNGDQEQVLHARNWRTTGRAMTQARWRRGAS